MNTKNNPLLKQTALWEQFRKKNKLSDHQLDQFKQYAQLLVAANKKFNITTITSLEGIIESHFQDSLGLLPFIDFSVVSGIADVGTGGGFPGIPLKIMNPNLFVLLVEVNQKKVNFLREVIAALGLTHIEVCDLDWRTFLRKTSYPIDMVCARASLSIQELLRMFKADSPYDKAELVYWASRHYVPEEKQRAYVYRQEEYRVNGTERRLVFFKK